MKTFKFSLETLLKVKESKKKNAQIELTTTMNFFNMQNEILISIEKEKKDLGIEIEKFIKRGISVLEIKNFTDYYNELNKKIAYQKKQVKEAKDSVKKAQKKMIKIVKEINMLENLKEKQYQEYRMELNKDQEIEIEQIINYRLSQ